MFKDEKALSLIEIKSYSTLKLHLLHIYRDLNIIFFQKGLGAII